MKTKEIIGYKLKDEKYQIACERITGFTTMDFSDPLYVREKSHGNPCEPTRSYLRLKEANVLDLWFTPVYKEEPKPEIGKWYKDKDIYGGGIIFCVEEINEDDDILGYGFDGTGEWTECGIWGDITEPTWTPATDKEVEESLIKEAKRIGFVIGAKFKNQNLYTHPVRGVKEITGEIELIGRNLLQVRGIGSYDGTHTIFDNGKWAEIIKEEKPTKEEIFKQIEQLKEKINLL